MRVQRLCKLSQDHITVPRGSRLEDLENVNCEKDKKIESMEKKIYILEKAKPKPAEKLFKCSNCDFKTNSENGLKIHMRKKHTSLEKETYPRACDLSEKTPFRSFV